MLGPNSWRLLQAVVLYLYSQLPVKQSPQQAGPQKGGDT